MLYFIQELQYSDELDQIEPDPDKADEISRSVEAMCSLVVPTIRSYGVSRFQHRHHHLIVWYSTDGSTVFLLSIRLDVARMRRESVTRVGSLP